AILLLLWMMTMSQTGSDVSTPISTEDQLRVDSLRFLLGTTETGSQNVADSDMCGNAFPVFLLLLVLIDAVWRWSSRQHSKASVLTNVVAEQEIGPGQFIKVVSLGDEYLVLGVTPTAINLLKAMPKSEWNPPVDPIPMNKNSVFAQFMKRAEGKNEN